MFYPCKALSSLLLLLKCSFALFTCQKRVNLLRFVGLLAYFPQSTRHMGGSKNSVFRVLLF